MAQCQANIQNAQKQANSTIEQLNDVIDEFLDELPIDFLDDKTLKNLYDSINSTVNGAKKSLAKFRHDNGIKLERTKLSNQEATDVVINRRLLPALKKSFEDMSAMHSGFKKLKGFENYNVKNEYKKGLGELIERSLPPEARNKWITAGRTLDTLPEAMMDMSHQQRLDTLSFLQDGFPVEMQAIAEALSEVNALNATSTQAMRTLETLKQIEFEVNGAIDTAQLYARNPYADSIELSPEFLAATEAFNGSVDRKVIQQQFVDDGVQNLVRNQVGSLTESMASKMLKSQVPGAQMFALNILETPSGFAGDIVRPNTASIASSMKHKKAIYEVNKAYSDLLDEVGKLEGWSAFKRQMMQDGHARTHPEIAKINQDIMLHINDMKLGRGSNAPPHIKKYADIQTKAYHKLHHDAVGKVEGITATNKINHYDHQIYNDQKFLELAKSPEQRDQLIELFRKGLVQGGMDDDLAQNVADAVIQQKMNAANRAGLKSSPMLGEQDMPGLMPRLQDVVDQLVSNKVRPQDVKRFIDAFQGGVEDMQPGYANRRLNIDLSAEHTIGGEQVRILDLMDQDSPGRFDKYAKESTARTAIAEAMPMLNSDNAINNYLFDTGKQAQMLGTSVDTKAMRNTINLMLGHEVEGALPMDVRKIRDLISLSGMGGLGESQLAETGMAMNRGISGLIGTAQMLKGRKSRRSASKGIELTPEQMGDSKFLSELEELTGLFQESHRIVRRNVHYDQKDSDVGALSKLIDMGTGGKHRNALKAAQDRFTGYGAIRSMQDQLAMAGLIQDINKARLGNNPFTSKARFRDLGIDVDKNNVFFRNIDEFATFKSDGTIKNLNIHKWSPADREVAGIVLNRHAGQVVQAGYVGEMSPMMDNPWVAFMMQFRSYPLLAAEKQQARNLKFADREAATGLLLNAVSSSGSRIIRYASIASAQPVGEREEYFNNRMKGLAGDTWAYMGNAGMSPTIGSYANQLLGNPFGIDANVKGLHTEIPALTYATKLMSAHDSVTNGEPMNDNDYARIQSLIPLGTIGFVNIMAGIFRTGLDND